MNRNFFDLKRTGKLLLLIVLPLLVKSQDGGIHFENDLSWAAVKAKARKENKYIFMDCYATWCIPCKQMDQNIYPQKSVGDFFNTHFISVAIQMDQTPKDSKGIRDWYIDAKDIKNLYQLSAYPTFLFFSPDGQIVHRVVGTRLQADQFLEVGSNALDSNRQYYTLIGSWQNHLDDLSYLARAIKAAEEADREDISTTIGKEYMKGVDSFPMTAENIKLAMPLLKSSHDKLFPYFLTNATIMDSIVRGKDYTEVRLSEIIYNEEVLPQLQNKNIPFYWMETINRLQIKYVPMNSILKTEIEDRFVFGMQKDINVSLYSKGASLANWDTVRNELSKRYPGYNTEKVLKPLINRYYPVRINIEIDEMLSENSEKRPDWSEIDLKLSMKFRNYNYEPLLLRKKMQYYAAKKIWSSCDSALYMLLSKYRTQFNEYLISESEICDIIYDYIFMQSENRELQELGLQYMKVLIVREPESAVVENDVDTYANLLYKTGNVKEAMIFEKRAIDLVTQRKGAYWIADSTKYTTNLSRMEKGEKTWNN